MENYNVDYFIKKFEAISEEFWAVGAIEDGLGRRCAMGHCTNGRCESTAENIALVTTVMRSVCVPDVNNGCDRRYQQPTPKQRILAALYDIKKAQQGDDEMIIGEVKVKTVYVTVDESVRELQEKELSVN